MARGVCPTARDLLKSATASLVRFFLGLTTVEEAATEWRNGVNLAPSAFAQEDARPVRFAAGYERRNTIDTAVKARDDCARRSEQTIERKLDH